MSKSSVPPCLSFQHCNHLIIQPGTFNSPPQQRLIPKIVPDMQHTTNAWRTSRPIVDIGGRRILNANRPPIVAKKLQSGPLNPVFHKHHAIGTQSVFSESLPRT
jgi:hypothetical protein